MKIIQIGVGGFGWGWTDIIKRNKEWEIAGYVDIDEEILKKREQESKEDSSKFYKNLDEALNKIKADAVIVITPPKTHKEICIKALRKGLNVLVEKPLSDNFNDAKLIVEKAKRLKRKLMVSQNYRYRRAARSIREIIEENLLGEVGYVSLNFHKAPKFTGFRLTMPDPLLLDMSIHHFDLMRYILGVDPLNIYAKTWKPNWSWFKSNPSLAIIIQFQKKIILNYFAGWVSTGAETTWDGSWRIQCGKGAVILENDKIFLADENKMEEYPKIDMPSEDRDYSLYEFTQSIKEKREPETFGKDNLKSLNLIFSALSSIKENKAVKL